MASPTRIRAVYHEGALHPLAPLTLAEDQEVTVTIEPAFHKSAEDVLALAAAVYQGLPSEAVADIESIALDRRSFFREPA